MDSQSNPMYLRLTRHSKWPSERRAKTIGVTVGVAAFCISAIFLFVSNSSSLSYLLFVPVGALVIGILLAILSLPVTLVVTAAGTSSQAHSEDFDLVRVSGITTQALVSAFIQAAIDRMRVLHEIAFWLLPGGFIGTAYVVGSLIVIIDCFSEQCGPLFLAYVIYGSPPALFVTAILMLAFVRTWRLAINGGVLIGLRFGQTAIAVAAGVGLAGLATFVLTIVFVLTTSIGPLLVPVLLCLMTMGAIPIVHWLGIAAQWGASNTIERKGKK